MYIPHQRATDTPDQIRATAEKRQTGSRGSGEIKSGTFIAGLSVKAAQEISALRLPLNKS